MEMVDGLPRYKFMGFPVVFNNIVNTVATEAGANKIYIRISGEANV